MCPTTLWPRSWWVAEAEVVAEMVAEMVAVPVVVAAVVVAAVDAEGFIRGQRRHGSQSSAALSQPT